LSVLDGRIAGAFDATLGLLLGSHSNVPGGWIDTVMGTTKFNAAPDNITDRTLNGFFITGQVFLINVSTPEVDLGAIYAEASAEVGFDAMVFMDFSGGGFAFQFDALAYADFMGSAGMRTPPCGICLKVGVRLGLSAGVEKQGEQWEVWGQGCGSLSFLLDFCGVPGPPFEGKIDIVFSSVDGINVIPAIGESCGGNAPITEGVVCQ
jgi:hypothetical protein